MNSLNGKQIQIETLPAGAPLRCRYVRVEQALQIYPWKRAKLYQLMGRGVIRSFLLKERGSLRGIRLLDRDSIDQYLERQAAAAASETMGNG
jgi:hypothetical protein